MISVCMATYNGAKYLREQVDSILMQLGEEDELIVSDDGSTDDTIEILEGYNDNRIHIFYNNNRTGVVGNFEYALCQASGEYIFLADQDDVWINNKVEKCVAVLQNADLVVTDCYVTDSNLNIIEPSFFRSRGSRKGFWKNLFKNSYLGACVAFRADLLRIVMPIPPNLPVYHEGWIASLADITGEVIFSDFKGIFFRRHENNTSCTAKKTRLSRYGQLRYRIVLLWLIAKRLLMKR